MASRQLFTGLYRLFPCQRYRQFRIGAQGQQLSLAVETVLVAPIAATLRGYPELQPFAVGELPKGLTGLCRAQGYVREPIRGPSHGIFPQLAVSVGNGFRDTAICTANFSGCPQTLVNAHNQLRAVNMEISGDWLDAGGRWQAG